MYISHCVVVMYVHDDLAGTYIYALPLPACSDKQRWTLLKFEGDKPPNRLDHSMCVVPWRLRAEAAGEGDAAREQQPEEINLCFVFGGMDTEGVIFNDCLVTVVT